MSQKLLLTPELMQALHADTICRLDIRKGYRPIRLGPLTFASNADESDTHEVLVTAVWIGQLKYLPETYYDEYMTHVPDENKSMLDYLNGIYPDLTWASEITLIEYGYVE